MTIFEPRNLNHCEAIARSMELVYNLKYVGSAFNWIQFILIQSPGNYVVYLLFIVDELI